MIKMLDPGKMFYNDLPAAEVQRNIDLLRDCPAMVQLTPQTNPAYLYLPTDYVFCEQDNAVPLGMQKWMVEVVRALGANVQEWTVNAGELWIKPVLSRPRRIRAV